ncbi:phage major tail tube protein [Paenibacillus ehimensis]|uniref:phage major tail tube protein n=1 Tax=Paenibacillus ehimensis TaxID=79264 RepID=UPI0005629C3D|nr:phage major tail tube protein [Paenibacillus ehimensis]
MPPIHTIPERLAAFRVYLDGSNDLKGIADIQLPKFDPMKDTVSGAGIAGSYESATLGHFQSMKLTLNWRTITEANFQLLRQTSQRIDCRGALQEYDAARGATLTKQVRLTVQGLPTGGDLGKFEQGAATGGSSEIEVLYIKIEMDGLKRVEFDKLNYICIIEGVDYLQSTRSALGL